MSDDELASDLKDVLRELRLALSFLAEDLDRSQIKGASRLNRTVTEIALIEGRIGERLKRRPAPSIESQETKPDHLLPLPERRSS